MRLSMLVASIGVVCPALMFTKLHSAAARHKTTCKISAVLKWTDILICVTCNYQAYGDPQES